jgi:transposase InsO family protein
MMVMDVFTRWIIGFSVEAADINSASICRMFSNATSKHPPPCYLSSDNDPLFLYHRWRANLRVLDINEIKPVPYTPISHPFVEHLIGTVRRELLDQTFFWSQVDLQRKLDSFKEYYNDYRVHSSIGQPSDEKSKNTSSKNLNSNHFGWKAHCKGLFQTPIAA